MFITKCSFVYKLFVVNENYYKIKPFYNIEYNKVVENQKIYNFV